MADYFVDHGAYATAIGATPTWGVPQEGDGSSKDAATASSIASIAFGSVPTTGTFSCCGISISTTGVIGAASADAAANTLASNINAVTSTVASGVAVGTPKLYNLVYARGPSGGAPAGTCQIMMRIGSTKLNYSVNSNAAIASTFDGTPTVVQFAGGSGGCWGYLFNPAAMGVSSSIAALAYGVMFGQPYVWTATPTANDTVWSRTGSGKTLTYSGGTVSLVRNQTWPIRLLFDSNIKWTGDSGTGVVLLDLTYTTWNSSSAIYFSSNASVDVVVAAVKQGGLKIKLTNGTSQHTVNIGTNNASGNSCALVNIDIDDITSSGNGAYGVSFNSLTSGSLLFRGMRFSRPTANSTLRPLITTSGNTYPTYVRFEGCTFTHNISGVSDPGPLIVIQSSSSLAASFTFSGCAFSGWASGNDQFKLMDATTTTQGDFKIVADNCTGLKLTSTYSGLVQAVSAYTRDPATVGFLLQSGDVGGPFRYEQRNGLIEWDPNASPAYPTLSAVQLDGSTKWAIKAVWMNNGEVNMLDEFKAAALSLVYRAAAATKTITLEMFMRSAFVSALDNLKMAILVTYVDNATGKAVTELLHAIPSSSSASWTGAGSWSGYAAYKLALTTANAIKQNTEVKVQLRLHGSPNAGQNENVFIDPEFGIA